MYVFLFTRFANWAERTSPNSVHITLASGHFIVDMILNSKVKSRDRSAVKRFLSVLHYCAITGQVC